LLVERRVRTRVAGLRDHLALGISNCRTAGAIRSAVLDARGVGVNRLFVAEDIGCRDAFQLGAVAGVGASAGEPLDVTISVTNPYLRSPVALAACALELSDVTGGRVTLGLGSSSREIIAGQLGMDYGVSTRIMREAVAGVRAALGNDSKEKVRIMIAAMGPRMLQLAGEVADAVILNTGTTPEYVRWARRRLAEGAEIGRRSVGDVPVAVWVPMYIGAEAFEERLVRAKRWAAGMLSIKGQGELLLEHAGLESGFLGALREVFSSYPHGGDRDVGARLVPHHVAERLAVIGTPDEAVQRCRRFVGAGVATIVTGRQALELLAGVPDAPRADS
jgi:5,10-methylenetetrahydromethanopterin reductase